MSPTPPDGAAPLTKEDRAWLAERHRRGTTTHAKKSLCIGCARDWPCPTAKALAEVERLEAERAAIARGFGNPLALDDCPTLAEKAAKCVRELAKLTPPDHTDAIRAALTALSEEVKRDHDMVTGIEIDNWRDQHYPAGTEEK